MPVWLYKKLQSPSMDFALRASVVSRHCSQICLEQFWAHLVRSKREVHGCTSSKMLPAILSLRERPLGRMPRCREAQGSARVAIGQEPRCHEAQGCARVAISSFFTSFALLTVHPCTTPHYASQTNTTAWTQEVERIRTNIGHIRVK